MLLWGEGPAPAFLQSHFRERNPFYADPNKELRSHLCLNPFSDKDLSALQDGASHSQAPLMPLKVLHDFELHSEELSKQLRTYDSLM